MPHFLLTVCRPNGFIHSDVLDELAIQAIDKVNDDMVAAGVRVFVGGLKPTSESVTIQLQTDGEMVKSEGSVLKGDVYADGLWVLDCANQEEAVKWGRKAGAACRSAIEVRPFY
ncbi:MAG: hypothetical protein JNM34_11895 [Chthonomonadaceae bacterium]|nr:hypothetical protein [Chthonomonadaceae bacterium]